MRVYQEDSDCCPKCKQPYNPTNRLSRKTRHHVFPIRHFGGIGPTIKLCQACHARLEKKIPQFQKLPKEDYALIVLDFLLAG